MIKRILVGCVCLLLMTGSALAEVWSGTTIANELMAVETSVGGILSEWYAVVGMHVDEGEVLGSVRTKKVFATQDGIVARIDAEEGEVSEGTVLEIAPVNLYTIYCTVDSAYQSAESTFVQSGETLYIRCTINGTHRAIGIVTQIDSDEYRVMTIGGELYVGETVYLFRDAEFTAKKRVGIGTVVSADTEPYEAEGCVVKLHVQEGEKVERGELLYEYIEADGSAAPQIQSSVSGIVTEVTAEMGEEIEPGQTLMFVARPEDLRVEIMMDETTVAQMQIGDVVELSIAADDDAEIFTGIIEQISGVMGDGGYAVRIIPERTDLPLGLSIHCRT